MSKMRQTLEWVIRRARFTSSFRRRMACGSSDTVAASVLSAMRVLSMRSSASYTSPIPPRAMKRTTW